MLLTNKHQYSLYFKAILQGSSGQSQTFSIRTIADGLK